MTIRIMRISRMTQSITAFKKTRLNIMTLNTLAFGIRTLRIVALIITGLSMMSNIKHWNTQYNEKQQNDSEHNCTLDKTEHNDIKRNDFWHNDNQDNDSRHYKTQRATLSISKLRKITLSIIKISRMTNSIDKIL